MGNPLATYSGSPDRNPIDAVRFACGDTDVRRALLTDGEITHLLTLESSIPQAALAACYAMLRKAALRPNETVGPVTVSNKDVVDNIKSSIASIKYDIATTSAFPWAGGISVADKLTNVGGDVVQPVFKKTMLQPAFNEGDGVDTLASDGALVDSADTGPEI